MDYIKIDAAQIGALREEAGKRLAMLRPLADFFDTSRLSKPTMAVLQERNYTVNPGIK